MLQNSLTSFISIKEISNEYNHHIAYLIIQFNDYTTSPNHLLIQHTFFFILFPINEITLLFSIVKKKKIMPIIQKKHYKIF